MNYIGWTILLISLLSVSTLFFTVNNITLRTFSSARLREAFKQIGKEELTEKLIKNSEKLILVCSFYRLILNTIILLLLVWAFSRLGQKTLSVGEYILSLVISAVIYSIFALAVPHAWAKYAGEAFLCRSYATLRFFAFIIQPLQYVFSGYDLLVKRLTGTAETTAEQLQEEKEEDFLTDLEEQKLEGVVDSEEQRMIEKVLALSDKTAGEILTPRTDVVAIEENADLNTVLGIITEAGHSRYPVYQKNIDRITGLVYAKDLLTEIGKKPEDFKLSSKLREAYFVPETKPLRELLREFQNRRLHIAIVIDEFAGFTGIITLEDIIEELVGEIADEYEDSPPKPIQKIDADTIEVDGRTYINELNDQFEMELPESENYDTIAGFILFHLGYIPKTGVQFDYGKITFNIVQAEPRRIKLVRIKKIAAQ